METLSDTYATSSFPSGHVGAAVTLYGSAVLLVALASSHRARTVVLGVLAAAIVVVVAFCRMYRGFHYPFDVVAGLGARRGVAVVVLARAGPTGSVWARLPGSAAGRTGNGAIRRRRRQRGRQTAIAPARQRTV